MKRQSLFTAAVAPLALGAGLALSGCSEPSGEVVLVLTTDMSIPKDIDAIQVEVEADGVVQFYSEYTERQGGLKLPGTLGIVDDPPGRRFTVRVIGLKEGRPRIFRAITTTTVDGGARMLRAPLRWLCDGSAAEGDDGRIELAKCPPGEACFADSCAPSSVEGSSLPEFSAAEVFGGGTGQGNDGLCFDTTDCFNGARSDMPVKMGADCTVEAKDATNVALRTEGDGICGGAGCFVPLDEGDPEGFTEVEGSSPRRFRLPSIVCEIEGRVLGVALSAQCAPKTASLPTCGPWSVSGDNAAPSSSLPITLAAGQHHPTSLALAGGRVFWTNTGAQAQANGSVKRVPTSGGTPFRIAADQAFPSALVVDGAGSGYSYVFWINEDASAVSYALADDGSDLGAFSATTGARHGLALAHGEIFWTTANGQVWSANTAGTKGDLIAQGQDNPARIAVDDTGVYWTNRGDGKVMKAVKGADSPSASELAWEQARPVALAVSETHVYWLNQGQLGNGYEDGAVMRVVRTGTSVETGDEPEIIATSKSLPYALAIDDEHVYWTNLLDGSVMRAPISGGTPKVLAEGQSNPVGIAVDQEMVYWANAGTSAGEYKDGAIMKAKK